MSVNRIIYEDQDVYIKGERLRGVQSCVVNWAAPETFINSIGFEGGLVGTSVEDYLVSSFEVERLLISPHDPIIDLFVDESISGEIKTHNNNYAFNSGHITSYSCSCEVGSIPVINFSIDAYGQSGGSAPKLGRGAEKDDSIAIANPGSIALNVEGYSSNAIQSFDFLITIGRQPVEIVGDLERAMKDDWSDVDRDSLQYIIQYPIEVDCQFVLIVQDYESSNLYDYICSPKKQDLTINFGECDSGESIRSFFIPSAKLVDFSQDAGIGDSVAATFTYKSLVTNIQDLKKITSGQGF